MNVFKFLCAGCGDLADIYDFHSRESYCDFCFQLKKDPPETRRRLKAEFTAFESAGFTCPYCRSDRTRPTFAGDADFEARFLGCRTCENPDCQKSFMQSDAEFLKQARIEHYKIGEIQTAERG